MESNVAANEDRPEIKAKMQFTGKVVKTSLAGALIDVGVGTPAVMHVSQMINTEDPKIVVNRVDELLKEGDEVNVYVHRVKDDHIELTMIKPLELEWREIKKGMTVKGKVVRLEKFGAFVEIGAERPGLVHISEMAHGYVRQPSDMLKDGDEVEAEVLEVNRRKKQIKLSMKALQPVPEEKEEAPVPASKSQQAFETGERAARAPRTSAPRKKQRKQREKFDGGEISYEFSGTPEGETEPTFMEIAMREAMERAKSRKQQAERSKREKVVSREQEQILSRTLEQKSTEE
jgi:ribosomal protein S1